MGKHADAFADGVAENTDWLKKLQASLNARTLFLALFAEGINAVVDCREQGNPVHFEEVITADAFTLRFGHHRITFTRNLFEPKIEVQREGFTPRTETFTAPSGPPGPETNEEIKYLAEQHVKKAMKLLARTA